MSLATTLTLPSVPYLERREKQRLLGISVNSDQDHSCSNAFVTALRGAVTGVTIVSTDGVADRFAITVSAFSSVSADPPLVLVCINRRSPACAAIESNNCFCVNLLNIDQRHLADSFSGRSTTDQSYDFDSTHWDSASSGAPRLADCIANFDCQLLSTVVAGTHSIFVGQVLDVKSHPGEPLLYINRGYGQPVCWMN